MQIVELLWLLLKKERNKMATKMIKEGKETYASKSAMMKHEKKEPMKKEKAEEKMPKGKAGIAIMIGVPKKMMGGGYAMKTPTMMSKGGMTKKKK
jgi:hypothetical protein